MELEPPHTRRRTVSRLEPTEIERLIQIAYRSQSKYGLMIKTLFQTGARVDEFVHISLEDLLLDGDPPQIHILHAKRQSDRYVPIMPTLADELRTHLQGRHAGFLFESNRHTRYSTRTVQSIVTGCARAAGIEKRVYPHLLRHSIATILLDSGLVPSTRCRSSWGTCIFRLRRSTPRRASGLSATTMFVHSEANDSSRTPRHWCAAHFAEFWGFARLRPKQKSGKIINIASLQSFTGGITIPAYAASKGGVAQVTKALANEWARHGVNVNAIAPGYILTDLTQPLFDDPSRSREILERIPVQRWGRPEDMEGPIVFLASPASDFVHGHIMLVDDGWMAQ